MSRVVKLGVGSEKTDPAAQPIAMHHPLIQQLARAAPTKSALKIPIFLFFYKR